MQQGVNTQNSEANIKYLNERLHTAEDREEWPHTPCLIGGRECKHRDNWYYRHSDITQFRALITAKA